MTIGKCPVCGKEMESGEHLGVSAHCPQCGVMEDRRSFYIPPYKERLRRRGIHKDGFAFMEPIGKKPLPDEPPEMVN